MPLALSLRGRLWADAAVSWRVGGNSIQLALPPSVREAATPEDRVLQRASGAEGVCGLLAVGYHYPRRNRGHARVPVSVPTDVTGGG